MRRDHFTLRVAHVSSQTTDPPAVVVGYDGPAGDLTSTLRADGVLPDGEEVDVALRLQDPVDDTDPAGVFSVTRRLTGEYLLEADATAADILAVVERAREEDGAYRVRIERPDADALVLEKETLLVYDAEGSLRRQDSLIPSGVEL